MNCYMRYGNAGQLYRTCNDNFGVKGPRKPPDKFTPLITQAEFIEEIGIWENEFVSKTELSQISSSEVYER